MVSKLLQIRFEPSGATQFCWASHKTFGTKGHTNLQRRDEFAGGYGGAERWPSWGSVEGMEREKPPTIWRKYRNPTTIRTLTQPPCALLLYHLFLLKIGGKKQTNLKMFFFLWRKELVFLKLLPPLQPILKGLSFKPIIFNTWNAKCPIFLGNFTPKTSNYCLKDRALGFPGTMNCWFIFASQKIPRSTDGEAHRFGEKNKTSNDPNIPDRSSLILGSWISTCTTPEIKKMSPWKREPKIERIKTIFLNHPFSVGNMLVLRGYVYLFQGFLDLALKIKAAAKPWFHHHQDF